MRVENLSYRTCAAITPSDGTNLPQGTARAIYTGSGGSIALQSPDTPTVTFLSVPAGQILAIQTSRVLATGTTATGLIAMYG